MTWMMGGGERSADVRPLDEPDDPTGGSMRVGFACLWDRDPRRTWSHTPWYLREAMRPRCEIVDLGVQPRDLERVLLKAASLRRRNGTWTTMWKHGRVSRALGERRLRSSTRASSVDVVLQVQDLGVVPDVPFAVYQDFSYDVLWEIAEQGGFVPHFNGLTRSDLIRLRDRQRRIYESASAMVTMSRFLAEHLARVSQVPPERIHVVPPGVVSAAPLARRLRSEPAGRLLFVGKDFFTKGGDVVVSALPRIREQLGREISLTVVGPTTWPLPDPPGRGVRFLGRLPSSGVAELWADHDAFVMPSRLEGFGLAFVEALSAGLPCVGRRAFAMPEIIEEGVTGRLVDRLEPDSVAQAVCQVLDDPQMRTTVETRAEGTRRYFSWDRAATDMLGVLRAVAGDV